MATRVFDGILGRGKGDEGRLKKLAKRVDDLESRLLADNSPQAMMQRLNEGVEQTYKAGPDRWKRIKVLADFALKSAGLASGKMLEIGGRENPRNKDFAKFDYHAMDLTDHPHSKVKVQVGDITDCPHIPDESFDFIFSLDVFEHISKPWLAGQEITRLLRPGGVTFHSTLFSWRYHPCPGDYFRYTPEGLQMLFPDLECIDKGFDYVERRRNILGRDGNKLVPDAFGGWRENVRVNYSGMKPKTAAKKSKR